jgi:DNA-binding NtrC family response regulator
MFVSSWILVLADELSELRVFEREFQALAPPKYAASFVAALPPLRAQSGLLAAALDMDLVAGRWLELLREIRAVDAELPVLGITRGDDHERANELQRLGGELCFKPIGRANVRSFLDRALRARVHAALRRWVLTGATGTR